jgi:hypothetical protein
LPAGQPLTFEEWQEEILKCEGITKRETEARQSIRDKINRHLGTLDRMMCNNDHLKTAQSVEVQVQSVSKYWSSLSDSERDYLNAVRYALAELTPWNLKTG